MGEAGLLFARPIFTLPGCSPASNTLLALGLEELVGGQPPSPPHSQHWENLGWSHKLILWGQWGRTSLLDAATSRRQFVGSVAETSQKLEALSHATWFIASIRPSVPK